MAHYGITDESQLIDYMTIKKGCEKYIDALNSVLDTAKAIVAASQTCTKQAMSVDGQSMEETLYELGKSFSNIAQDYAAYANEVYEQAIKIYNAQVAELNEYNKQKAIAQQQTQQQAQQAQQQTQSGQGN